MPSKYVPVKNFTPRQIEFATRYYTPTSKTYCNAYRSAVEAGYSEKTAKTITTKGLEWMEKILLEIVGKSTDKKSLVEKSKKVLCKSLDSSDEKLAQDTAKFITGTTDEFSKKGDLTSGGNVIELNPILPKPKRRKNE